MESPTYITNKSCKMNNENTDTRRYSSDKDEMNIFETRKDAILSEGLGFYRFDSSADDHIVDYEEDEQILFALEGEENFSELFGSKKKRKATRAKRKEKRKDRREKRKEKVKSFFDRQKQNVKNVVKDPVKAIKKGLEEVGKGIKQGVLAVPRGSALALIALNYRGLGTKIASLSPAAHDRLKKKWEQLGGQQSKLFSAAENAKGKKALACGSKCRAKLPSLAKDKSNFDGYNIIGDYHNVAGGDDIAALIAAGSAIIGTLAAIINKGIDAKKNATELEAMKQELEQQDKAFDEEQKQKSAAQRKEEDLAEKALLAQMSPIQQIQANPNLTAEEKAASIVQVNKALGTGIPWKPIMIGGGILAVIGIGWMLYSKKK